MPAGAFITRQARETAGLENVYLMGADALFSPDVAEGTGEAVEGFLVSSPDLTAFGDAYTAHFVPAYLERFGTEPISVFHAHAYDAVQLLLMRIEQVAVVDADGALHIGRQALRDALYATVNYPGLTGDLTCSPTGDCADPVIAVYRYHFVDGAGVYPPERIWPYP
jgi:branched-chain amino acid transport system substrate-binding protein